MCTRKFIASSQKKIFQPYSIQFLERCKRRIQRLYQPRLRRGVKASPIKKNDATKELFDGFKASFDQVIDAGAGDHGPYLVEAVEAKGITVERITVSTSKNPATGETWVTSPVTHYAILMMNDRLRLVSSVASPISSLRLCISFIFPSPSHEWYVPQSDTS